MSNERETIDAYEDMVRKNVRDHFEYKLDEKTEDGYRDALRAIRDDLHEIADSATPVDCSTILELAVNDIILALEEPEIGPAFDGKPTPINIIAANIYERLVQAAHDEYDKIEQEIEDGEFYLGLDEPEEEDEKEEE